MREFAEETGLKVSTGPLVARADQLFLRTDGRGVNNRGGFYALALIGEDTALKIEDDHTLVWLEPNAAVARLRHDAHAWAVAAWLRLRARD